MYVLQSSFDFMRCRSSSANADGIGTIFGHIEAEAQTTAAEDFNCIIDLTAVFRIPVNSGTYVIGMVGDQCDISISSSVQGAQLNASDENTLTVVYGDATNNAWVDVMMTPSEWGTGAGVDD